MSSSGISGLDASVLLGYYQAQRAGSASAIAAGNRLAAQTHDKPTATSNDNPPWNTPTPTNAKTDAHVLATTKFLDTSKVPLTAGATTDAKTEQDNQKLFALYSAVNSLAYLAKMAQGGTVTDGQRAGLDTRFQAGLAEVQQYLTDTSFNNFTLQAAKPSDQVTSSAAISFSDYTYKTKQLVGNANLNAALPGLSASDSFTIAVKKGGATTNVVINLSQVTGGLTLNNVISYINGRLSAGGFSTRLQKTTQGDTATSSKNATYGIQVSPGANETLTFSAASTPALYLVGSSGTASESSTVTNAATNAVSTSAADQTGRLTKLSGLSSSPTSVLSVNQQATSGTTAAQKTVVDSQGNIYVVGTATGNFGNQLNQGTKDVYLTKYDSAGHQTWSKLLGSGGSASGYGLALDPSGGVVVTGASTGDLTNTSVADGNNDAFVAKYAANGDQSWIKQIQTLATNQSNSVSVDASGNIYIGGSVSGGVVGVGQTAQGKGDAFLAKFDSKGKLLAEKQFGTSGADNVAATATAADGSLYVASVQNGHAILAKYTGGAITSAPTWSKDLGDLQAGGGIGGLAANGSTVYLSGTTGNAALTASGQASIAHAASGGMEAFVFALTDNGASATATHVTYVGTGSTEQGGAVSVGPDGTVYLAGTTKGTFAGQARNVQNTNNAFAAAIAANGSLTWTRQFGGADGQSTGNGIAIDPNGASVLDALGLPRGTLNLDQSVELTSQTTLRAGDSFQIATMGAAARTATITIDQGETVDSLITKINGQLGGLGKASINYGNNSESLKIQVNPGTTLQLVAGPGDFDALARLGIPAGTLTAPAKNAKD
ncbi:MAG: SBBP repeat-containing protein, partial [Alphaproteobacteria bacterium]|nr:SBBP repeat-containing protein [Alphaproteobacteria bacterium]